MTFDPKVCYNIGVLREKAMPMSSPTRRRKEMSRYAKPGQTIEDLKSMIEKEGGLSEIIYNDKLKVHKDLLKVDMGMDKIGFLSEVNDRWGKMKDVPNFETIEKDGATYPIAWCYAKGDGEQSVAFVTYIGHEGKLRAYIPNDGNNILGEHRRTKEAWTMHSDDKDGCLFDYESMRDSVKNRISVKGADGSVKVAGGSGNGGEAPLTFKQIIQSLRRFEDQHASVMPVAKGAEDPVWGIEYIWFENGILNLGQYDDEGDSCDLIANRIEECVPSDLLDEVAVVRVGVTEEVNGKKELYDRYGKVSVNHTVTSSVVKPCRDDDWFCKWTLKFA